MIKGHEFCGIRVCPFNPDFVNVIMKSGDGRVAMMVDEPWQDKDEEEPSIRVAIFQKIDGADSE
jgi:hypothetical protein